MYLNYYKEINSILYMADYGSKDCEHDWVHRKDGFVEECYPVVCLDCGAFGCLHDTPFQEQLQRVASHETTEKYNVLKDGIFKRLKEREVNGDANPNGRWINPYVDKKKSLASKV